MHLLGKFLIGLIILAAGGGAWLTAKMHSVRNSWTKQVESLKTDNEASVDKLVLKRRELADLGSELDRAVLGWDRYWDGVDVQVLAEDKGTVQAQPIGSETGLVVPNGPELPVTYMFRPTDDGGYIFTGAFRATTITPDRAAFAPTWTPRDGEVADWRTSETWRIRSLIPSAFASQFAHLHNELRISDQQLADRKRNLDFQNELLAKSEEHLAARRGELLGNEEVTPIEGRPEVSEGLVKAIAEAEEMRNEAIVEVDRLRRLVNNARKTMHDQIQRNKLLAKSLETSTVAKTPNSPPK